MERAWLKERIITGFAWSGATKALVQMLTWVSTIYVARLLEPSDFGLMAVAGVFIFVLSKIVEMGLAQGLVQKESVTEEEERGVFYLSLAMALLLYAVLYLAAPYISAFYDMPPITGILQWVGVILILASLKTVPLARVTRRMDFRYRSLVDMASHLSGAITTVSLAVNGFGVWSLAGGVIAINAVVALGYLPMLRPFPWPRFRLRAVSGVVSYGMHIMGANIAFLISNRSDVFIIGRALGERLTGYYALAFQLASIPLDKLGSIFNNVAFAALSRAGSREEARDLFLQMHRYLLLVAYPLLIGLALVANDLVRVLLTEKWLPIVPVLQVLVLVNLLRLSGMLMTPLLNARGRVRQTLTYSVAGMFLLPVAFLIGVQFGLAGVVAAWVVAYPILYALISTYLFRELQLSIRQFAASMGSATVASLAMIVAVVVTQLQTTELAPHYRLVLSIMAGAITYFAAFALLFSEQVAEVKRAIAILLSSRREQPVSREGTR